MIDFEFRGGKYRLYFNGLALFDIYKKYGQEKGLLEMIENNDKESFETTIWMLCEFSKQGALYGRFLGEEPAQVLNFMQTLTAVQPAELVEIQAAVISCINEGFTREHPSELDSDPFLAEIEKSKKKQYPKRNISERLRRAWACLTGKE